MYIYMDACCIHHMLQTIFRTHPDKRKKNGTVEMVIIAQMQIVNEYYHYYYYLTISKT